MANITYTTKDILQQEFKTKMRGYDPVEVDEFLDGVIKDYEAYNKEILTLQEENDRLNAKIAQLSKNQATNSRNQSESTSKSQTVTNFDILKRLSNLEKEVFGKKLDQEENEEIRTSQSTDDYSRSNDTRLRDNRTTESRSNTNRSSDDDDLEKTRQF
ncbi:MAG: cell division regulator GpsB [Tetragenococcus halophilus]|uniref:cell division regulator GpsB n=1 Tax=Tetragenococcus halophilus TaxID=51669 RepID=UPI001928534D|nr:cell division regulator GpsB [Tetragenococcus halophilus]MCF1675630.1 cell division regulator GpsB [Tetragenococcus halophilus]MDN5831759.1 cell division regulator GpsB [Tetragenococcus halophilus]MDN6129226.1 cell division regulator GpsB [Tetragenococcus halophilus]MDN6141092.1 cell division regulator GpsB [Tetragenococcus halophilus]MDN6143610.1 cell division regulator GpsB [Tetragenococcus halophilus]